MDEEKVAAVWVAPGRCGGSPCIYGTRLTTQAIARIAWDAGVDGVRGFYPQLSEAQVFVACWYEAKYGDPRWKKRLGPWVKEWQDAMWRGDWSAVPPPPKAA